MTWTPIVDKGFTAEEFAVYLNTIKLAAWKPQFVVLHNTGSPTLAQWHTGPTGEVRELNLEHYYRDEQDWSAGPHLFIADDKIWAFTPLDKPGVHSPSWNRVSWGVEVVGDFDTEPFGEDQRTNVIAALTGLHKLAGIDPKTLHFHYEDPLTTHKHCPGKNIVKAEIVAQVTAALAGIGKYAPTS